MALDKAIELSLRTWYPKDHPLHNDPLHPAIGLAGEAGELLDLYKKERFKDGVSWWDCTNCGQAKKHTLHQKPGPIGFTDTCKGYTPKILDELGDLWYYLRILAYQSKYEFNSGANKVLPIEVILANLNDWASSVLIYCINNSCEITTLSLGQVYFYFERLLTNLDFTLDQVTESNWQKLKDGDNHGWKKARDTAP